MIKTDSRTFAASDRLPSSASAAIDHRSRTGQGRDQRVSHHPQFQPTSAAQANCVNPHVPAFMNHIDWPHIESSKALTADLFRTR